MGYRNIEALKQSERDFSACALGSTGTEFVCLGSGTSFPGRYIDLNTDAGWSMDPNAEDPGSAVRPYMGARDSFNYNPYNYYQRPDERWSIAAFAHYDVTDKATVYTELSMMDDHTVAQIAPSGLSVIVDGQTVYSAPLTRTAGAVPRFFQGRGATAEERFGAQIRLSPGLHRLSARIQMEDGSEVQTADITVEGEPGATRELSVIAGAKRTQPIAVELR